MRECPMGFRFGNGCTDSVRAAYVYSCERHIAEGTISQIRSDGTINSRSGRLLKHIPLEFVFTTINTPIKLSEVK